jgi:hypothetical protein
MEERCMVWGEFLLLLFLIVAKYSLSQKNVTNKLFSPSDGFLILK